MSSLLNQIQQKLKVPKGQYNRFAKYHYRNAEDILEEAKKHLGNGTLIVSDEVQQVGDRYYVKATAHLSDGEGGVWFAYGWAREEAEKKGMDAAQITGAASSYARKYALNGLFCIDDTKDADNHDNSSQTALKSLGATKPEKKEYRLPEKKDADKVMQAKKDRIKDALGHLGEPNDSLKDVADAVKRLIGKELQIETLDETGDALWRIVEGKVDPLK